jgi:hypothetical protein
VTDLVGMIRLEIGRLVTSGRAMHIFGHLRAPIPQTKPPDSDEQIRHVLDLARRATRLKADHCGIAARAWLE